MKRLAGMLLMCVSLLLLLPAAMLVVQGAFGAAILPGVVGVALFAWGGRWSRKAKRTLRRRPSPAPGRRDEVVINTPEEMTRYIVEQYDSLSWEQLGQIEKASRSEWPHSEQLDLIYALRVGYPIRSVKRMDTLLSRWENIHRGAGGSGLVLARGVPNHPEVTELLEACFVAQFMNIAEAMIEKAAETAAARKTVKAKMNTWSRLAQKLADDHRKAQVWPASTLRENLNSVVDRIDQEMAAVGEVKQV